MIGMTFLLDVVLFCRAGDLFERIKGQYGAATCYLLQINSRASSDTSTESLPDPWSQFLRHQRYTVCTVVCVCVYVYVCVCVRACARKHVFVSCHTEVLLCRKTLTHPLKGHK